MAISRPDLEALVSHEIPAIPLGTISPLPAVSTIPPTWQPLDGSKVPRSTHPAFYDFILSCYGLGFSPNDPFAYFSGALKPYPPIGWRVAIDGVEVPDWSRAWAGQAAMFIYIGPARA